MERGAIERGEIAEVSGNGYIVMSLDRDGITTPPLDEETYSVGDKVYYFYFRDGTGRIICGFS